MRNHVNPFAIIHQEPFTRDKSWAEIFEDPTKKIHLGEFNYGSTYQIY
ncbi:hypothetical protein HW132_36095 [Brasilonema sp. CT11]|nr:hypothetical protein [Brasilonema sp. CT11]